MRGIRRTAVVATALLFLSAAWAAAETPRHVLPAGTVVVFVADGHLDASAGDGANLVLHLRDPLVLDGAVIAAAGTHARLLVGSAAGSAQHGPSISLDRFTIAAGLMPIRSERTIVLPIALGETIDAKTQGEVEHVGDRYSIRIPFPFPLSADRPAAAYTATPSRTAPPRPVNPAAHRPGPPTPLPTVAPPSPLPSADLSPEPAAGSLSTPTPPATKSSP